MKITYNEEKKRWELSNEAGVIAYASTARVLSRRHPEAVVE
jgi:hypothetical protein